MKIASLSNNTQNFKKLVIPDDKNIVLNTFYTDEQELSVYFTSTDLNESLVKISYPLKSLDYDEELIFNNSLEQFLKSLVIIFIISSDLFNCSP